METKVCPSCVPDPLSTSFRIKQPALSGVEKVAASFGRNVEAMRQARAERQVRELQARLAGSDYELVGIAYASGRTAGVCFEVKSVGQ